MYRTQGMQLHLYAHVITYTYYFLAEGALNLEWRVIRKFSPCIINVTSMRAYPNQENDDHNHHTLNLLYTYRNIDGERERVLP